MMKEWPGASELWSSDRPGSVVPEAGSLEMSDLLDRINGKT